VNDMHLVAAGCLQGELQRIGNVFSPPVGAKLPGHDVAAVHFYSRDNFKLNRTVALAEWRQLLSA